MSRTVKGASIAQRRRATATERGRKHQQRKNDRYHEEIQKLKPGQPVKRS